MKGVDAMGTTKKRTQDVEIKRFYFNIKSLCDYVCIRTCYWISFIDIKKDRLTLASYGLFDY